MAAENVANNQLYAESRIQQGRQREPNVKTFHFQLSAEFLNSGTQRQAFIPCRQSGEIKILIHSLEYGSNP